MTSQFVTSIVLHLIYIIVLLYIGNIIVNKFSFFKKLYLPASFIGGLIGLIINQFIISPNVYTMFIQHLHEFPRFFIIGILATIPLGFVYKKQRNNREGRRDFMYSFIFMALILNIIAITQNIVGLSAAFFLKNDFYGTFGTELAAGFSGGHGTAGIISNILFELDQNYWMIAQDIAITFATIGLIGGLCIGVIIVNVGVRLRYTNYVYDLSNLRYSNDVEKEGDITERKPMCHTIFHIILILFVSICSMYISGFIKMKHIPILTYIPGWGYGLIFMFITWGFIQQTKLKHYVHKQTNQKIATSLTDITIVAAVSSVSLQVVYTYIIPVGIIAILGFVTTFLIIFLLAKWVLKDDWLEKSLTLWGTSTGVFMTGIILLRIVDPRMKSNILEQYSIAYAINNLISFIILPLTYYIIIHFNVNFGILTYIVLFILFISLFLAMKRFTKAIN